jgi:hypothetical protein
MLTEIYIQVVFRLSVKSPPKAPLKIVRISAQIS